MIKTVTDETFNEEVLNRVETSLVYFRANWCGPCKAVAPMMDVLSKEYEGKVQVCVIDVDESPGTPGEYGVRAIPNLIIIKDGNAGQQFTGVVGIDVIRTALDDSLDA